MLTVSLIDTRFFLENEHANTEALLEPRQGATNTREWPAESKSSCALTKPKHFACITVKNCAHKIEVRKCQVHGLMLLLWVWSLLSVFWLKGGNELQTSFTAALEFPKRFIYSQRYFWQTRVNCNNSVSTSPSSIWTRRHVERRRASMKRPKSNNANRRKRKCRKIDGTKRGNKTKPVPRQRRQHRVMHFFLLLRSIQFLVWFIFCLWVENGLCKPL